jgi:hypothetical protein
LTRVSIDLQKIHFAKWMDGRVEPGHDAVIWAALGGHVGDCLIVALRTK